MFAIKDIVEGASKAGLDKLAEEIEKPKIIQDENTTQPDRDEFARVVTERLQDAGHDTK